MEIRAISVDDELVNLLLLEEVARTAGIELISFSDPREAASHVDAQAIDIAFVDYLMPEMDGLALVRHIRARQPEVPVVMITSLAERDIKLQALEAGANDFLSKPVDAAEFLARAKNLLDLRRSQLLLKDRAAHLEDEVRKATATIAEREYETLAVLGRAAEYKDPETARHIDRVAYTARMLAAESGLRVHQQELVFHAAPLHDVGKMGIPDSILMKAGALDPGELAVMRTHTEIGHRILRHSRSAALKAGAEIAMSHHERFDGSGYPLGLRGGQIPLFGRIVSLADCYDALVSRRPYKEAWPVEQAVATIRAEGGRQFDPALVERFVRILPEIRLLYDRLKDE